MKRTIFLFGLITSVWLASTAAEATAIANVDTGVAEPFPDQNVSIEPAFMSLFVNADATSTNQGLVIDQETETANYTITATGPNPVISQLIPLDLEATVDNQSTEYAFVSLQVISNYLGLNYEEFLTCGTNPGNLPSGIGFGSTPCEPVHDQAGPIELPLTLQLGQSANLDYTAKVEAIAYSPVDEPQRIYLVFAGALLLVGGWRLKDRI